MIKLKRINGFSFVCLLFVQIFMCFVSKCSEVTIFTGNYNTQNCINFFKNNSFTLLSNSSKFSFFDPKLSDLDESVDLSDSDESVDLSNSGGFPDFASSIEVPPSKKLPVSKDYCLRSKFKEDKNTVVGNIQENEYGNIKTVVGSKKKRTYIQNTLGDTLYQDLGEVSAKLGYEDGFPGFLIRKINLDGVESIGNKDFKNFIQKSIKSIAWQNFFQKDKTYNSNDQKFIRDTAFYCAIVYCLNNGSAVKKEALSCMKKIFTAYDSKRTGKIRIFWQGLSDIIEKSKDKNDDI